MLQENRQVGKGITYRDYKIYTPNWEFAWYLILRGDIEELIKLLKTIEFKIE